MIYITIIFVFILSLFFLTVTKSILFPGFVLLISWFLSLSLYVISGYSLNQLSSIIILFSCFSFSIGTFLSLLVLNKSLKKPTLYTRDLLNPRLINILKLFSFLSLFGALRYGYFVISNYGILFFLQNKIDIRFEMTAGVDFSSGFLTYVFQSITIVSVILNTFIFVYRREYNIKKTYWLFIPILSAVIFDIFYLGRIHTITCILIFILINIYHLINNFTFKKLKSISLIVSALLFFLVTLSLNRGREISLSTLSNFTNDYINNFSRNWYLFDNVVANLNQYTTKFGSNTFGPEYLILNKLNIIQFDPREMRLFNTNVEFDNGDLSNTYTLLSEILVDFGFVGTIIFFFLIGFISTLNYIYNLHRFNIFLFGINYLFLIAFIFSVQANIFSSIQFRFEVLFLFLIYFSSRYKVIYANV